MPRRFTLGMMVLVLLLAGGAVYFVNLQRQVQRLADLPPEARAPSLMEEPAFEATTPRKRVVLFFASSEVDGRLEVEERHIYASEEVALEAKQILVALIKGPRSHHVAALPSETRLREVYWADGGLMVVDITGEASVRHPGGITGEVSSIYSVVNSLTYNLPAVSEVRLLIDGAGAGTVAGHVDLRRPLPQDLSMTALQNEDGGPEINGLQES
ncbi:MAG: GerMN domain-containing protein [Acidobacteria bacterium]|nr:GerMN domain-containing protein [Acidobacteriota bacterium]